MPNKETHLALGEKFQETIDFLSTQSEKFPEWITIVAFYKALHFIEAILATDGRMEKGGGEKGTLLTNYTYFINLVE